MSCVLCLSLCQGADGVTRVWDLGSSSVLCEFPPPSPSHDMEEVTEGAISALTFSPDGALLAASLSSCITVYDTRKFVATPSSNRCVGRSLDISKSCIE